METNSQQTVPGRPPFTRRRALAAFGGALALSACSSANTPATPAGKTTTTPSGGTATTAAARAAAPGRLFADTAAGLSVVDLATGAVTAAYPGAVPDTGWSRIYQLHEGELRVHEVAGGRLLDRVPLPGEQIKAVSGELIAVGPRPGPRARTTLTLYGRGRRRTVELPGNVEPEAFSSDGQIMYVLDHRPPT
ncbi:hypothetical protein HII36_55215, partial [Nonomuraea sp. NN258]|uniref:hypothetical protein n=1 Tax=Nonomuraea antri TaxID=2730852 RepID=UPI001C2BE356|nr:hypothetical protein [Nonomuraea antri]